jgi:hypothetical protein
MARGLCSWDSFQFSVEDVSRCPAVGDGPFYFDLQDWLCLRAFEPEALALVLWMSVACQPRLVSSVRLVACLADLDRPSFWALYWLEAWFEPLVADWAYVGPVQRVVQWEPSRRPSAAGAD